MQKLCKKKFAKTSAVAPETGLERINRDKEYLKSTLDANIRTQVSTLEENVKNILFRKDEEISNLQVECEKYQIVIESKQ